MLTTVFHFCRTFLFSVVAKCRESEYVYNVKGYCVDFVEEAATFADATEFCTAPASDVFPGYQELVPILDADYLEGLGELMQGGSQ